MAGISRDAVTQTVVGSPGVYDPQRNLMALTGGLPDWDRPEALAGLRAAFGPALAIENDVDAAALAERALGHGRDVDDFAFVHVGTGIGMGLVLGGRLHRGVHGVAGEIAFLPIGGGWEDDPEEARRRGALETIAGADGVVRAARRAGLPGLSAQAVFEAAARATSARRGGRARGAPGRRRHLLRDHRGRPVAHRPRRRHRPGTRIRRERSPPNCAPCRPGAARGPGERARHGRGRGRLPGRGDVPRLESAGLPAAHPRAALAPAYPLTLGPAFVIVMRSTTRLSRSMAAR